MMASRSTFPVVPVALTLGALAGLVILGMSKKKPEDRSSIPVLTPSGAPPATPQLPPATPDGGVTSIRIGQHFTADLSGTLLGTDPSVRTPGAEFQALEDANEAGVHQGFAAAVISKHLATGEIITVPLSRIQVPSTLAGVGRLYSMQGMRG
jgi:hypothetical protein